MSFRKSNKENSADLATFAVIFWSEKLEFSTENRNFALRIY